MESQRKGNLTEPTVLTELVRRGIAVSIPFGDNERYDVVVESPSGRMVRAQIKTGWARDGTVVLRGYSQHTNSGGNTYKPYADGIDCFLVYSHVFERLFLVWVEEVRANKTICIEEPDQRHETTNWAGDFDFDERWPPTLDRLQSPPNERNPATRAVRNALQARNVPFVRVEDESHHFIARDGSGSRYALRVCSGSVVDGRIRFNTITADGDAYCIYCSQEDEVYLVPDDDFDRSISLRVEEPDQPDASINWADDYAFDRQWPPE